MPEFTLRRVLTAALAALAFLAAFDFISLRNNVQAFETRGEWIAADTTETNPLLNEWKGNYGGVPPFDKVQIAHFKPALEAAMAENLKEIDDIADNSATPTFENTIAEMERAGSTLERVSTVYGIWTGTMSNPEMRESSAKWDRNSPRFPTRSRRTKSFSAESKRFTIHERN
jgi:peptidyl-dipeptidase Dcp